MKRARATWLPVPGFLGYEVSDRGVIRNARTGRQLRLQKSDSGYLRARIWRDGKQRSVLAHLAVLRAFVGEAPSPLHDGAHEDGRRTHNALGNLGWKLPVDNEADKKRVGTAPRGFTGHKRADHVPEVRRMLANGLSYTRVARSTGLHRSSVSRIARGLRHRAA